MSMLSAQCDELRERAKVLRQGRWSDGAEDAKMMEDAADTIWELRCKLSDMVDDRERARVAEAENAKLRMFIDIKETCLKHVGWCDACPYNGVDDEHDDCSCTMQEMIKSYARELGIEVG